MLISKSYENMDKMFRYIEERKSTGFISKIHNLTSQESYNNVLLYDDEDQRKLSCQVFPKYGEEGHVLVYFIGKLGNSSLTAILIKTRKPQYTICHQECDLEEDYKCAFSKEFEAKHD